MTGGGIVLADRDASEVELRDFELQQQFDPKSPMGKILVRQMAVLSIRMERSADQEEAAIADRVRHAPEAFDQARLDEVERLLGALGEAPRIHLRKLKGMPEGVDALIDAWLDLRGDLTREPKPLWTAQHRERAENLTGVRPEHATGSRICVLSKAIWGDFYYLDERQDLDDEARQAWARGQMVERIDAEIARLEAHYETLDFETIALDRFEAPRRALFDPSKEATLARRYESEANRGFFKALKELRRVEKEAAANPRPVATPEVAGNCEGPLGSFREAGPTPREPRPGSPRPAHPASDSNVGITENRRDSLDRPPVGSP